MKVTNKYQFSDILKTDFSGEIILLQDFDRVFALVSRDTKLKIQRSFTKRLIFVLDMTFRNCITKI